MANIFLTTEIPTAQTAASKARIDVLDILKGAGYQTVYLPLKMTAGNVIRFWKQLSAIATKGTHIVIEYPCWMKKRMYLVYLICKLKGIKLYGVIHDIGSLREGLDFSKDLAILKLFNGLVGHNPVMNEWLREKGFKGKLVPLNVFDYLLNNDIATYAHEALSKPAGVFYAGNLDIKKAAYIYDQQLNDLQEVQLQMYGINFDQSKINHHKVKYMGSFEGSTPKFDNNFHFGLIWEGTSTETCAGPIGEYIRYNNPHKFSLYLALGLPVIVWKEAAIAPYILENKLGLTIGKLSDLDTLIPQLDDARYQELLNNVKRFTGKVRTGDFLLTALKKLSA